MTDHRSRLPATLLAALVFVFGMEMMRFQFGSLGWYLRDTVGIGALDLIPLALIPLVAAVVVPILARVAGIPFGLWVGASALVVGRLATQVWSEPAVTHWTSGLAVAAFVGLLPLLLSLGREVVVGGILIGVTLDTAIKALGSTLDLAYRPGLFPQLAVGVMAAAIVYLLAGAGRPDPVGPGWGGAVLLLALGPFLFVQYLVLQSAGWMAELTGTSTAVAGLRITLLNLVAVWLAHRLGGHRGTIAVSALLVALAMLLADQASLSFDLIAMVAIPACGPLWAALVPPVHRRGIAPATIGFTFGSIIFLMVGFAYYLPLDLRLGISQANVRIIGGALLALVGLVASLRRRLPLDVSLPVGAPALSLVALLLPAGALLGTGNLASPPEQGPVRYMSYNLHQAFDTAGRMDVEAIARVIVDSGATVVGLQEVARAGLLNANTDLLHLLGPRLGFEHVAFIGTTDPVWGNAILSRYPLGEVERELLPTVDTPYRRGYLAAPVQTPDGEVLFITTHLQHVNRASLHDEDPEADLYPVHREQLRVVIDRWGGRQPAVLTGDLNARPGWRQVEELLASGWVDSWDEKGEGPGYTANAADPRYRIDYVFHTPDLETVRVEIIDSQASDHFPVVADLARR